MNNFRDTLQTWSRRTSTRASWSLRRDQVFHGMENLLANSRSSCRCAKLEPASVKEKYALFKLNVFIYQLVRDPVSVLFLGWQIWLVLTSKHQLHERLKGQPDLGLCPSSRYHLSYEKINDRRNKGDKKFEQVCCSLSLRLMSSACVWPLFYARKKGSFANWRFQCVVDLGAV